ncbi:MAG: SAM-dependent methyltransferase, partial [Pseudomonadota bacterium]|nr:SAM-dependent methyltransferase [Pseudomonadota bacterium]
MRTEAQVSDHYTHGGLLDAVRAAIHQIGKTAENVTVEDLAGVDEFHIGGWPASVDFFRYLGLTSSDHALDVGCGLGGPARTAAVTAGCQVTGVDLT